MASHRWLVLAACVALAMSCATDLDCNLNGVCNSTTHACMCDAAWIGATCERLVFRAAAPGAGTCDPSRNGTAVGYTTTWGGLPQLDAAKGLWHLHVAEMASHCGMTAWGSQSQVGHYRSSNGVTGPYARVDTAIGPFAHNPVVIAIPAHVQPPPPSPDGQNISYIMFHIGMGCNSVGVWACNYTALPACTNGSTPVHPQRPDAPIATPPNLFRAHTHVSSNLDGPWVSTPSSWTVPGCGNNPAPLFLANGSLLLVCHEPMAPNISCPRSAGLYTAVSVTANWATGAYLFGCLNVLNPTVTVNGSEWTSANEDPHVYADTRGALHILTHNQSPGYANTSWFGGDVRGDGGHFFSADSGDTWHFTWFAAYDGAILYNDGVSMRYKRERPKLVTNATTGELIALANGVGVELVDAFQPGDDVACTIVLALGV